MPVGQSALIPRLGWAKQGHCAAGPLVSAQAGAECTGLLTACVEDVLWA